MEQLLKNEPKGYNDVQNEEEVDRSEGLDVGDHAWSELLRVGTHVESSIWALL